MYKKAFWKVIRLKSYAWLNLENRGKCATVPDSTVVDDFEFFLIGGPLYQIGDDGELTVLGINSRRPTSICSNPGHPGEKISSATVDLMSIMSKYEF